MWFGPLPMSTSAVADSKHQLADQPVRDRDPVAMDTPSAHSADALKGERKPESSRRRLQPMIDRIARQYGVEAVLVHSVISAESAYNSAAVSSAGAIGLMQLMPATAADYGVNDPAALFEPETNLRAGTRHLKRLLSKYGNDYGRVIMAYNAGEGVVDRTDSKVTYTETLDYAETVIRKYRRLGGRRPTDSALQQIAALRGRKDGPDTQRELKRYLDQALLPKASPNLRTRLIKPRTGVSPPSNEALTALEPWRLQRADDRPAVDPAIRFRRRPATMP